MFNIPTVNIIGAGNVAFHLAKRFTAHQVKVLSVYSKTDKHTKRLSEICEAKNCADITELDARADIFFIAVNDHAIGEVSDQIHTDKLVLHTSGITPLSILSNKHKHAGVWYPLQTLHKDFTEVKAPIPVLIESLEKEVEEMLGNFATHLGMPFQFCSSEQRQYLHLAAVLVNNFGNFLSVMAEELTASKNLSFDLLRPLILETANRIQTASPKKVQTGPAIRGDIGTMEKHLALLNEHPDWQVLYKLFSAGIEESKGK